MRKVYRILGVKDRITIPEVIRNAVKVQSGDVISFSIMHDDIVIHKEVPREKLSVPHSNEAKEQMPLTTENDIFTDPEKLKTVFKDMTPSEREAALVYLLSLELSRIPV